ncbi:MAG TPA: class I SAM-dependent methyltransferase [Myxococcota bacterium]
MQRSPEPELMDDAAQALAYARADFAAPHDRFVALLCECTRAATLRGAALDLGCGAGDVTFRVANALPRLAIDGVDGSEAMLALAREDAARRGLAPRVRFARAYLPDEAPPGRDYALVYSNSLLHHLRDPAALWQSALRFGARGAPLFVGDLLRPESDAEARALVLREAGAEPELLQRDFFLSLCAAYTPSEVCAQLAAAGLAHFALEVVSDRHWVAWGSLP